MKLCFCHIILNEKQKTISKLVLFSQVFTKKMRKRKHCVILTIKSKFGYVCKLSKILKLDFFLIAFLFSKENFIHVLWIHSLICIVFWSDVEDACLYRLLPNNQKQKSVAATTISIWIKCIMQAYGTHTEPCSCFKLNEFFKYLLPRAHLLRKETKQKKTVIYASWRRLKHMQLFIFHCLQRIQKFPQKKNKWINEANTLLFADASIIFLHSQTTNSFMKLCCLTAYIFVSISISATFN